MTALGPGSTCFGPFRALTQPNRESAKAKATKKMRMMSSLRGGC